MSILVRKDVMHSICRYLRCEVGMGCNSLLYCVEKSRDAVLFSTLRRVHNAGRVTEAVEVVIMCMSKGMHMVVLFRREGLCGHEKKG